MKNQLPYGGDRVAENTARTDRVMGNGYKSGGSVKSDEAGTKISITIGGPPTQDKQNQGLAGLAALAQAAKPPMPPPMMGAPPPPGPGGPGAPPPPMGGMKRGGRIKEGSAAEEATESKSKEAKEKAEGMDKHGGRVPKKQGGAANMDAGAGGARGRLEKAGMK